MSILKNRFWLAWIAYAMVALPLLAMIGFSWYCLQMSGMAIHDGNFEIFSKVLTPDQGEAILRSVRGWIALPVLLFTITNIGWLLAMAAVLYRWQKRLSGRSAKTE